MASSVLPRYADRSLADLLPSVAAALEGRSDGPIELPVASRYVVFLVDGLGWHNVRDHVDHAEALAPGLAVEPMTCGVPSTTATSLTSLGCGVFPGRHGVVGYSFRNPSDDRVMNALNWEGGPADVSSFALSPTVFAQLGQAGRGCAAVSLERFNNSPLTRLAFAGTRHFGITNEDDSQRFLDLVAEAVSTHDLVYCYSRQLDFAGHGYGVGSWQWLEQLGRVDDLVSRLIDGLPDDVCLVVTGDHGMVNVPMQTRIVAEDEPALSGFTHIAGEGRLRQLYGGDPSRLAARWERFLGERALVLTQPQAVEAGWFGPDPSPAALERIGDVLVAAQDTWAIMSRSFPGEFSLVGMHGSLSPAEMEIPLLVRGPR
ncbi:MAG: alkaline phosphatase family protein [Arachnia sp.]